MQIRRFIFIKSLGILSLIVIFTKIYQQNRIIKLQYEKQRLERQHEFLTKKYNNMLVQLSYAKDYSLLKKIAQSKFAMTQLQLSHLITFTGDIS